MVINLRTGLFRVWLLIAIGCWSVGGYYAYKSHNVVRSWEDLEQQLREEYYRPSKWDADGNVKLGEEFRDERINKQRDEVYELRLEAEEARETAVRVMYVPIGALIVYFVGGWIVRGFANGK